MRPPSDLPAEPTGLRRLWDQTWFRALVIASGGVTALVVVGLALTVAFWSGLDHGNLGKSEVERLRVPCGLGAPAFDDPTQAFGEGFQEHTYTYRYADRSSAWVDRHVLGRFGDDEPVASREALVADEYGMGPQRTVPRVIVDQPEVETADGSLVYYSPIAESEMGTTWFDVYRRGERFTVVVSCNNTAGVNFAATTGAVTTTVP